MQAREPRDRLGSGASPFGMRTLAAAGMVVRRPTRRASHTDCFKKLA
jgi:hypothetical protein